MRRASHYGSPGVLFIPRDVVQPGSIPRSDRVGRFTNRPYTSCRPDQFTSVAQWKSSGLQNRVLGVQVPPLVPLQLRLRLP